MREFKVGDKVKVVKWRGKTELGILGSGTIIQGPTTANPTDCLVYVKWYDGAYNHPWSREEPRKNQNEALSIHQLVHTSSLPPLKW